METIISDYLNNINIFLGRYDFKNGYLNYVL